MDDTPYPATLDIDYPDGERNRLTTFLRPILVIPIAIVLPGNMYSGAGYSY